MEPAQNPRRKRVSSIIAGTAMLMFTLVAGCGEAITQPQGEAAVTLQPSQAMLATPWAAYGPGTVTLVSNGVGTDAEMTYALSGSAVWSTQTWELSTTAASAKTVVLPYTYSGFHAWFRVRMFLEAFVTNGAGTTVTPLLSEGPVNCCTSPSGGFLRTGSVSLTVAPGDTYGFRFGGSNFDGDSRLLGRLVVDLPDDPTSKADCKNGGWEQYGFKNQGQCVRFIETGKDSR